MVRYGYLPEVVVTLAVEVCVVEVLVRLLLADTALLSYCNQTYASVYSVYFRMAMLMVRLGCCGDRF